MAVINDPVILKFVDELVRKAAKEFAIIRQELTDLRGEYNNNVNITGVLVAYQNEDTIENRTAQGVPTATKAELETMVSRVDQILAVLDAANAMDVVYKFQVGGPKPF